MTIKIVLEGAEALSYLNGAACKCAGAEEQPVDGNYDRPAVEAKGRLPRTRRARRVEHDAAVDAARKAEEIGQLPLSAAPSPVTQLKASDASAIVRAYVTAQGKNGTAKLVEKLTAAGVKRVPELEGDKLTAFLQDLRSNTPDAVDA